VNLAKQLTTSQRIRVVAIFNGSLMNLGEILTIYLPSSWLVDRKRLELLRRLVLLQLELLQLELELRRQLELRWERQQQLMRLLVVKVI
jgi:hypothetical protein